MLDRLINKTSIRSQLFITVAAGIFLLLAAQIYASTWVSNRQARDLLIEQSLQATTSLADNSRLALLYDSVENASTVIRSTLAFPGVSTVHIFRADGSLFYSSQDSSHETSARAGSKQAQGPAPATITTSQRPVLLQEDDSHWEFIAPVSTRSPDRQIEEQLFSRQPSEANEIIGYVLVSVSKDSLKTIGRDILLSNLSIALPIGLLILLILHYIIERLTRPLQAIAEIMKKTEQGEYATGTHSRGPLEVHTIAHAYNRMVSALAERDEALRQHNLYLKKQALNDHLTGLTNRIGFEQGLRMALDECRHMHVHHVLCYLDLDRFKIVNDTCGHNAGDELLKIISSIFGQHVRKDSDLLARIGGDEFALLLKNCSLQKAQTIGENICEAVKNYRYECRGQHFSVGVSIGIIPLDDTAGDIEEVTARVDSACYAAKAGGRGRVYVLDSRAPVPDKQTGGRRQ